LLSAGKTKSFFAVHFFFVFLKFLLIFYHYACFAMLVRPLLAFGAAFGALGANVVEGADSDEIAVFDVELIDDDDVVDG
jgi:hypothetical protein